MGRSYSPLEHLALSLFLNRGIVAPETCWLAMLTAYFDDSGKHGQTKAAVFSGFVSSLDQWLHFDDDWRAILRMPQFDLEYFHMRELRAGKGRFAKFKDNLPLQTDLFERIQLIIKVRAFRPFAGVVILDDYDKVNSEFVFDVLGTPIVQAGSTAIGKLVEWKAARYPELPLKIVVDQGMSDFGMLDDLIYARFGFRVVLGTVKDTPALQASDFFAWEMHRAATLRVEGKINDWSDYRKSFLAILDRFGMNESEGVSWFLADEAVMRKVCDLGKIPSRDDSWPPPIRGEGPR